MSVLNALCVFVLMLPPTGGQTEHQVSYSVLCKGALNHFLFMLIQQLSEFILIVFTLQDFGSENQI